MVHEVYEGLIMESFQGVNFDYLVPCPDCLKAVSVYPTTSVVLMLAHRRRRWADIETALVHMAVLWIENKSLQFF